MTAMDYIIKVTDLGSNYVTLTSSPYSLRSGGGTSGGRDADTVTETYEVRLAGGSTATNLADISLLNALLNQAQDAQTNQTLSRIYLTWQATSGGAVWRSEIKKGYCDPGSDVLTPEKWRANYYTPQVFIERTNYWEGEEVQCTLTNGNGTNTTSGLKVYACGDGTGSSPNNKCNYVAIDAAEVTGDLPAATRLEFTNTYSNGSDKLQYLWIGHSYSITDYANFPHILEGESATNIASSQTDAACSAGHYGVYGPISAGTSSDLYWTLTAAQSIALRGGRYHLLVRFKPSLWTGWEDTRLMPYIAWTGSSSKIVSNQYLDNAWTGQIRDLGTVKLPPYLTAQAGIGALLIYLRFTNNTAANITPNIDFLALMPGDSWRALVLSAATNYRVVDDAINTVRDLIYVDNGSGTAKYGVLGWAGSPIMLRPGLDQRLYFLMHPNADSVTTMTGTVKLFFRPRKLTI